MARDALGAQARDKRGITEASMANPVQAALASVAAFAFGGLPPVLVALAAPGAYVSYRVSATSLLVLAILGAVRVTFWGALAMAVTAGIGAVVGARI